MSVTTAKRKRVLRVKAEKPLLYSEIFPELIEGLEAARDHFRGEKMLPTVVRDTNDLRPEAVAETLEQETAPQGNK